MEIWQPRDKAGELLTMKTVETEGSKKGKKKESRVKSTYRPSTFRSITNRVLKRLSRITLRSEDLKEVRIDKVYPGHAEALRKAGLAEQHFPTFGEVWGKEELEASVEKKKKRHNKQNVYLVIGFSKFLRESGLPKLLKRLCPWYNLSWLWINIAYRQFTNLCKKFSGDLMGKINNGIKSLDFKNRPCNCSVHTKKMAMCTDCDLTYIGVMQCMFKRQIVEHITGAHGQVNENMSALSMHMVLQKHWQDIPPSEKLSPDQIRKCKHSPEFHRFANSADESCVEEKVDE
eukprot:15341434-Ditylum_brightwellii.AAC.1